MHRIKLQMREASEAPELQDAVCRMMGILDDGCGEKKKAKSDPNL
jgi:hypothetical protein